MGRRSESAENLIRILSVYMRFDHNNNSSDNIKAYCPFHKGGNEQTPGFYLYVGHSRGKTTTGDAYCHTCGRGWHLSGLLKSLKVSYRTIDSLKSLIDETNASAERKKRISLDLPTLPEGLLGVFDFTPLKMVEDGFPESLLEQYEIGFDRERSRITFPIRDHKGDLVGVSGRTVLADEFPRYKIYRSEFYGIDANYSLDKAKVLWGLDQFYVKAMRGQVALPIVICEGFKATLKVVQSGYPYVVSLFGTSISDEQKFLLTRVANDVILFLDNDTAGIKGTHKAYFRLRHSLNVMIADYPRYDVQPEDLDESEVIDAICSATTYMRWNNK